MCTPIHVAAEKNCTVSVMKLLLDAGGDINVRRDTGATPLFLAAQQSCSPDLLKFMISRGAIVDAHTNVRESLA